MKRYWLILFICLSYLNAEALKVPVGNKVLFSPNKTITTVINNNKSVVAVQKNDKSLSLTGLSRGEAYVYYWDVDNVQRVLKVTVTNIKPVYKQLANSSQKKSGKYDIYFKADPKNSTPVNQRMLVHKLDYSTDLNGVGVSSYFEYQNVGITEKSNMEQLEGFYVRLNKNNNYLVVGDDVVQYTPLTAQYLGIQGVRGHVQCLEGLSFDAFTGKKPGEIWGRTVKYNAILDETEGSNLGGGRVEYNGNIKLGVTSLRRQGDTSPLLIKRDTSVVGVDTSFMLNDYTVSLETAGSQTKENKANASMAQLETNKESYGLRLTYRDIDTLYAPVSDYLSYQGAKGATLYGRYRFNKYFGMSGTYENYLQRYNKDFYSVINNDYTAEKTRVRFALSNFSLLQPSLSLFKSLGHRSLASGFSLLFDQITLLPKLFLFYEFSPWQFKQDETEYSFIQNTTGLSYTLTEWWALRLEHVSQYEKYLAGVGQNNNPHGYNFVMRLGDFILPRDVRLNIGYWFQNRKNSQATIDKNKHSLRLGLNQNLNEDLYWYLNAVSTKENSLQYEYEERIGYFFNEEVTQAELSGGLSYRF